MFRNYHGEPVVRLSRNESVHELPGNRKRTFFFQILSTLLFTMPSLYLGELEKVWVDDTVAYHPWRNFQAEMKKDWANSITPVRVLLTYSFNLDETLTHVSRYRPQCFYRRT